MMKGLKHLSCGDRLRESGLFSPEKALGTPYCSLQYIEDTYRKDGDRHFSWAC